MGKVIPRNTASYQMFTVAFRGQYASISMVSKAGAKKTILFPEVSGFKEKNTIQDPENHWEQFS